LYGYGLNKLVSRVEANRNGLPSMGLRESGRVEVLLAGRAELLHDAVHGTVPAPV
jgi:hypothetical protein